MPDTNENMTNYEFHKFEKNKYFYGKLMTVRDFETEQQYFDEKRYLINRFLHGTGIVCGFKESPEILGEKNLKVKFKDGGMALDCCGREIIVTSDMLEREIVNEEGKPVSSNSVTKELYLYLKYKTCYGSYVATASNSSSCEVKCCPGKVVEDFDVVVSNKSPDPTGISCRKDFPSEPDQIVETVKAWLNTLERDHWSCPLCKENEGGKVFLAAYVKNENTKNENTVTFSVDTEKTKRCRPAIFRNEELYKIFKCHILDFQNPHNVTASQIKALVSIDGVSNPGGNIDLLSGGSILIESNDRENSITIREEHSANKDNPHEVTAHQVKALVSVDGITSPGGNVDLVEGTNIKITPNPGNKSIKIDCLGLDVEPAEAEPKSIGIKNVVGTSKRYAREDHEHKLEEYFVDYILLSEHLQKELNVISMYLREKALKCSVTTFKKVAEEFRDERKASDISQRFKKAVRDKLYEREKDFIDFIKNILGPIKELKEEIKTQTEKGSFNDFNDALKDLERTISEDIPLKVASQLDEVCFFAFELKRNVNNPIFNALNCTARNFRKVSETFKNENAKRISLDFEIAVNNKLYENKDKFIDFMREKLQSLKTLQDEIKDTATEESLNSYASAVKKLGHVIESKDALNIAAMQEEVCAAANQLEPVSPNLMYSALECTASNFKEVYRKFHSAIANKISDEFEEGLKNKVYENKSVFVQFMKDNIQFLSQLPDEVKNDIIEKDIDNYVAVVKELTDSISSNDADKIAAKLKELCYFASKLSANSIYRALRCTEVNFAKLADIYENKTANEISVKFKEALDAELYDYDDEFIDFIKTNFELFRTFGREILDITTRESFKNYRSSVEKLEAILKSNDAHKIAVMQEEVCTAAKELEIHPPA